MSADLVWTPHFQSAYASYTGARHRVVHVVRQALRRRSSVERWYDGKRSVRGVDELVYELKVTDGHRLLMHADGSRLALVDIGDHEVTGRYAARSAA